MNPSRADLGDLLTFNDWAMRRLLAALADLTPGDWTQEVGGSFGTIQGTVVHMVGAERLWLERWKGSAQPTLPEEVRGSDPAGLALRWESVAADRADWWASLPEDRLGEPLSYRRLDGTPSTSRLDLLIRHVVNHATYHRGQVTAFLRDLGHTPPATDLVLWDRERTG